MNEAAQTQGIRDLSEGRVLNSDEEELKSPSSDNGPQSQPCELEHGNETNVVDTLALVNGSCDCNTCSVELVTRGDSNHNSANKVTVRELDVQCSVSHASNMYPDTVRLLRSSTAAK